jgi:hypothetical protein
MHQARPTLYKGVRMRSRLEASYAQLPPYRYRWLKIVVPSTPWPNVDFRTIALRPPKDDWQVSTEPAW